MLKPGSKTWIRELMRVMAADERAAAMGIFERLNLTDAQYREAIGNAFNNFDLLAFLASYHSHVPL